MPADHQITKSQPKLNHTIKGTAIVIQPSNDSRAGFFSSTVKLFRILQNSLFHSARILQSRSNPYKGIQTVVVEDNTKVDQLIQITDLGGYEVKCSRATFQKFKIGLIGPIEMDITEGEIVELLSELGYTNSRAVRFIIGKGTNQRTTKTMKIFLQVD